jgi:hypothetical protein
MVYKKQINGATVLLVHRKMQQGLKINFLKRTYGLKILEASYRWYSEWMHVKLCW